MSELKTQGKDDPLPVHVIQHFAQWGNSIDKPFTSLELSEYVDSRGAGLLVALLFIF